MTTVAITQSQKAHWSKDLLLIVLGSLFIGLCAQVSIPLPFTPVAVTLQTFALLLVGCLLGPVRGTLCVLAYLAEGALGLPVFQGGTGGIASFLSPRLGYIIGFVAQTFVAGYLTSRGWDRSQPRLLAALFLATVALYLLGLPYLALFVGIENVLLCGLYPFIPGDIAKILAVALIHQRLKRS